MRRVVVTGMGLLTPLGCGVSLFGKTLQGHSSDKYHKIGKSDYATNYACEIPFGDDGVGEFNADEWMSPKDRRKVDDFILYGICAADQAVRDAGWIPDKEQDLLRTGVMIESGIGGLQSIGETANLIKEDPKSFTILYTWSFDKFDFWSGLNKVWLETKSLGG